MSIIIFEHCVRKALNILKVSRFDAATVLKKRKHLIYLYHLAVSECITNTHARARGHSVSCVIENDLVSLASHGKHFCTLI